MMAGFAVFSIGFNLQEVTGSTIPQQWFDEKTVPSISSMYAITAVVALLGDLAVFQVVPQLVDAFLLFHPIRESLIYSGLLATSTLLIPVCFTFAFIAIVRRRSKREDISDGEHENELAVKEQFKGLTPWFFLLLTFTITVASPFFVVGLYSVDSIVEKFLYDPVYASQICSSMFASALVFAVGMGMFAKPKYYSWLLISSSIFHCSGCILLATQVHPIVGFILVGIAYGIGEPIAWTMVAYLTPERSFGLAFTFMSMSLEITLLILGILCGWFYDNYLSYDPTYFFLAAFGGIGLASAIWLHVYWMFYRKDESKLDDELSDGSGDSDLSDVDVDDIHLSKEDIIFKMMHSPTSFKSYMSMRSKTMFPTRNSSMGLMMLHRNASKSSRSLLSILEREGSGSRSNSIRI
eukprot:TRINITY_DN2534_c1_g2_i2.p1 TRINITY_DN2534_c1_g2~~TRINITY_DN2534_c1_g2_i2.p1  ORF type:complete len:408 (+),score=58.01 TRINITY_DN2534_c1_g2_i2:797-2020(+)